MQKKIILLMGKSGSGKTTIAKELYKKYGLSSIDSYTTRPMREPNENGHIFISDDEFEELCGIVGYTEFNGYKYCATSEQVRENDIYIIDPDGVDYFFENYNDEKTPVVIYLNTPDNVCYSRMLKRDGKENALERIENDKIAFKNANQMADEIITTVSKSKCAEQIYDIWRNY